jgi:RND family efflux transporter MFP subunit
MVVPLRSAARPRRAPASLILAAVAAGSLLAAGCGGPARADDGAAAAASDAESPPVAVGVTPAVRLLRPAEVRAGGVLEPRATADLAFQVGGRVAHVAVDEGDVVARGAVLARLDPTDYVLAHRQAELQAERAADERRRARALLDAGSIAPNDYERLDNGARQAVVGRDLAAKRLRDAALAAPFAGVVAARRIEAGATAAAGATVFTLVDLDAVHVRVGVPEADVGALRPGQTARVAIPALGREVVGRVRLVGVAADAASRTYPVEVVVPNADRTLRVGMVASVAVTTGAERAVIAVPAAAVARDPEGATRVYVHDATSGRARARRVRVGAPLGDGGVEIIEGLTAGEPVVVAAQERVRDGARVSAAPVAASPATGRTTP